MMKHHLIIICIVYCCCIIPQYTDGITESLWQWRVLPSNRLPFNGGRLGAKSVEDAETGDPRIYFAADVRWPGAKTIDPNAKTKEQKDLEDHLMRFTETARRVHRRHRVIMDPIALHAMKPKRKMSAVDNWYDRDPAMHKVVRINDLSRFVEATDWAATCQSTSDGTEPTICHGPVKPLEPGEEEVPPEPKPGPKDGWGARFINPTWVLPVNHNAPDSAKFFDPATAKNPMWVGEGEGEGEPSGGGGENPPDETPVESAAEAAEDEAVKEVAKEEMKDEVKAELKEELHDEVKDELKQEMEDDATKDDEPAPPIEGAGDDKPPPTAIKEPAAAAPPPADDGMPPDSEAKPPPAAAKPATAGEETLTEKDRVELRDKALPDGELPPERDRTSSLDEEPHYSHTSGEPEVPDMHPAGTPKVPTSENVGPLTYNQ